MFQRIVLSLVIVFLCLTNHANAIESCFKTQIQPHDLMESRISSIVRVVIVNNSQERISADTGFVVNGLKTIITSWHVLRQYDDGFQGQIIIQFEDGRVIGRAHVVARGSAMGEKRTDIVIPGDISMLEMSDFNDGMESLFKAIPGLEIAQRQSNRYMTANIFEPSGTDEGVSGSPVLNSQGQVIGIVTAMLQQASNAMITTSVKAGNISEMNQIDGVVYKGHDIILPSFSQVFIQPISDQAILKKMFKRPEIVENPLYPNDDITVPSYPLSSCVIFKGFLKNL